MVLVTLLIVALLFCLSLSMAGDVGRAASDVLAILVVSVTFLLI
jgi:hypothetical protein